MMTYRKFLEDYVDEMSDSKHGNIEGCVNELKTNSRLKYPLTLYLVEIGALVTDESKVISEYINNNEPLPRGYEKVLNNFEIITKQRRENPLQ